MSLTLDSSLFYTLLLLITEVRHHLRSNAPDTLPLVEISFPQLPPTNSQSCKITLFTVPLLPSFRSNVTTSRSPESKS